MATNFVINCNISSCNWYGEIDLIYAHFQQEHKKQLKEIKYNQHVDFHFDDIQSNESFLLYDKHKSYWLKFQKFENSTKAGIYNIGEECDTKLFYIKFGCYRENGCAEYYGPFTTKPEHSAEYDLELSYDALKRFKRKLSPKIMIYFIMDNGISDLNYDITETASDIDDNSDSYSSDSEEEENEENMDDNNDRNVSNDLSLEQNGHENGLSKYIQKISTNENVNDISNDDNFEPNSNINRNFHFPQNVNNYDEENYFGDYSIFDARRYIQANLLMQRQYMEL